MTTQTVIGSASSQLAKYSNRPNDEQFASMAELIAAAQHDQAMSAEVSYNWKDLRFVADGPQVKLASPRSVADLTHWSFGQAAAALESPAAFLRGKLTPELAAEVLNYRISQTLPGQDAHVLARRPNGTPNPTARAITSKTYGRLWDAEYYQAAEDSVFQSRSMNGHSWQNAPIWGKPEGLAGFRSDRDSFVLRIDGGSIVTDPSVSGGDGQMYRAVLLGNSEVGAGSAWIECIFYRYICGNWNLWGAAIDSQYRRRHVGKNVLRDVIRELYTVARKWTERSASQDERIIRGLIDHEIAHTKAGVIDELRKLKYTQEQAEAAYTRCEVAENASPRSFWGIAQGTTRLSQDGTFTDERYALDALAAAVIAKGTKQYALAS